MRSKPRPKADSFDKYLSEFELQLEYQASEMGEAMFQLTNSNDKMKIDLKKVGLIINELQKKANQNVQNGSELQMQENENLLKLVNQLNIGFAQVHTKAINNEE